MPLVTGLEHSFQPITRQMSAFLTAQFPSVPVMAKAALVEKWTIRTF
ncbi:hypothetical protein Z949_850 [Sulfitobacter guttiformis KCTC 32187]|nr:hypothetical protein Z949_850 [Sulfitobacter guttiformis KCTC 32187]